MFISSEFLILRTFTKIHAQANFPYIFKTHRVENNRLLS